MTAVQFGRFRQLDEATRKRVQAGCNYINAELARVRARVSRLSVAACVVAVGWCAAFSMTGHTDLGWSRV